MYTSLPMSSAQFLLSWSISKLYSFFDLFDFITNLSFRLLSLCYILMSIQTPGVLTLNSLHYQLYQACSSNAHSSSGHCFEHYLRQHDLEYTEGEGIFQWWEGNQIEQKGR